MPTDEFSLAKSIKKVFFRRDRESNSASTFEHGYQLVSTPFLPKSEQKKQARKKRCAHSFTNPDPRWGLPAERAHQCSLNQKHLLLYRRGELASQRVKFWNIKEKLIAAKRLKKISHQYPYFFFSASRKVRVIKLARGKDQETPWGELNQKKEERHFSIGRIIKYLSD